MFASARTAPAVRQQSIKQVSTRQQRLPICESENASKLENFFVGPPCHWLSLSPPHLPGRSAEGKFWMRTTPDVGSTIFPCVVNHFTTGCVAHKVKCCAHLEFPSAVKMTKGQESGDDGSTCTCGASCVGWNRHLLAWLWLIPWPGPSHGPWGPPRSHQPKILPSTSAALTRQLPAASWAPTAHDLARIKNRI